ncbi:PEP-CTERM sorting domain-containing protein [Verrucomicrobiaceae bacterium 5K15]|uniref:PEP-CTERM sorting domain-containing protein n=1 Tax=Oceaniferula flava TaxID=2800421 RepID=A0AAE2SAJ8_9BACT|nr:PEP-CTERM sorting domain-containing protein [Oceaniferula flavus]MBK1854303.1 PEP-CTERM sorting domain-containing protein [Oceaniferula flavus]MBM1135609.1 PEP-CTERM sorting domain-containing protein [Oceaniferula flavus]
MKKLISITALSIGISAIAQSATVTLETKAFVNYSDGSTPVTDNTGTVSVGFYDSEPTFGTEVSTADILSDYTALGSGAFEDSIGNLDGYFRFDLTENITSEYASKDVYIVLGNASTLEASDEFLVWKATSNPDGNTFVEDDPLGGPGSVALDNTTGSLLLGDFESGEFNMISVVPEPSSTALFGLGGLALLIRRRR